uniref:PH domain-containing protein n=1 Tax=Haptolina brevifila TaxID=156173 RepID=A0A7S2JK28_9EUKA|mmetsp:Transcript_83044/g.165803  ORF Transcript_83044/g.165803 Transcript_83044/m.165803 type:complete len:234 (+) Transcript_83044:113-814(+)
MLRSLSFSRRRRPKAPPTVDEATESDDTNSEILEGHDVAAHDSAAQITLASKLESTEQNAASDWLVRHGLKGKLLKRHAHNGGWGSRWFECDDTMGVLYIYRTELDARRKTPAHVHCYASIQSAAPETSNAVTHCFSITTSSGSLFLSCSSSTIQRQWLDGLNARVAKEASEGKGAQVLEIDVPPGSLPDFAFIVSNLANQPVGVQITSLGRGLVQAGLYSHWDSSWGTQPID